MSTPNPEEKVKAGMVAYGIAAAVVLTPILIMIHILTVAKGAKR